MSETGYKVYLDDQYMDTIHVAPSAKTPYVCELAMQLCCRQGNFTRSALSGCRTDNERREVRITSL